MPKTFLITGATGKQGGATVDALLSDPNPPMILALTRDPDSASAQKLKNRHSNIDVIKGDFNDAPALFEAVKKANGGNDQLDGLFSVQVPMDFKGQTPETEERQGKALVDEAAKRGVKHFVYTSVDRHGEKSLENPTAVKHFASKHNVELHLIEKAKATGMTYTILRPTAFLENFSPGWGGKFFATAWREAVGNVPLQFVSTTDIGIIAAKALLDPARFENKQIGLAGDELTFEGARETYKEKIGTEIPTTYGFLANGILRMLKDFKVMMKWFHDEQYAASVEECRKIHPGMMTFGDYLEKKYRN
ncbi:MAG: hypothetical protein M1820_010221 [Bogoriella megaspora]|nr:MAG: hypothetical protein M1820_010221 [Bogoriella megaspora]